PGSRLFSAHINILETSTHHRDEAVVLLARDGKEGRLYAVERVQPRTYALCRLGDFVEEEQLRERSKCILRRDEPKPKRQALQPVEDGQPWWSRAAVDVPVCVQKDTVAALTPMLSMQRTVGVGSKDAVNSCDANTTVSLSHEPLDEAMPDHIETARTPLSPLDSMRELAKHYLEALYLSRTSLAYFTKGPLSRARAAFSSQSPETTPFELVEFLRQSTLTSTVMDKKYRDGLPGIIKELPVPNLKSPEQPRKGKKKSKKFRPKRDKAGCFVDEAEYVERWWRAEDEGISGPSTAETTDAALRRRLPKIRSRETFLQIILALEILALQASAGPQCDVDQGIPAAAETQDPEAQCEESQAPPEGKKSKPKKKQDLAALLETLLDKLCIWHSLEAHSPSKGRTGDKQTAENDANDELRSFCIEVVVPFYISRIPQYATIVNKKLGGPSAPTPVKRKSTMRKPGEPAIRQVPEKRPRQPLARVSTDTLNHSSKRPPSIHRSATDTEVLSHIKREGSELLPSLDTIPPANKAHQRRTAASRPGRASLMHQISFSKREVDLSAMSQASEVKMRKKAEVEEKLREAISTLKKPNRALAVREMAESTDESCAKAVSKGSRGTMQQAKAAKEREDVQQRDLLHVTATPKHGRTVKATPYKRAQPAISARREANSSGGTSLLYVPSSSARLLAQQQEQYAVPSSSFAVPQTGHRPRHTNAAGHSNVVDTPSRGFAKFMPRRLVREPGTLESPVKARSVAVQQTPSKAVRALLLPVANVEVGGMPLRPPSAPSSHGAVHRTDKGQASVYDALGWDEEYDDLT
ncbi:hypothetical protein LTR37_020506, partial [Vermiconidia calcicola]